MLTSQLVRGKIYEEAKGEGIMERRIKIVADSSADLLNIEGYDFASVPLQIVTAQKRYIDDSSLDVSEMVADLVAYNGRSSTSCPNPDDYIAAFGDATEVYCITITGTLSGSYNAAMVAKAKYEKEHPTFRVHVINSLSTGPEMALMVDKICNLLKEGLSFDEVVSRISEYKKRTGLIFMLESMKNLANNGRVSPVIAKLAGLLGIRVVGRASEKGDLEHLAKCRGEHNALDFIVKHLREVGAKGAVYIAHCLNEGAALKLRELLQRELEIVKVKLYACRGLCSFYAERGGMLIGYEKA